MPKNEIDYSNTIIYKIICKDKSINDVYVGYTTNFIKRKYQHKVSCNNLNNNLNIYSTIRENGGWNNWEMVEIACYNCKNSEEAKIKEQEHYEHLISFNNSVIPYEVNEQKYCESCKLHFETFQQYKAHIITNIHKKKSENQNITDGNNGNKKTPKNAENFYCNFCDYKCSKNSDWQRHILRPKHKKLQNGNQNGKNGNQKTPKNADFFTCGCGKVYNHLSGLSRHKATNKCPIQSTPVKEETTNSDIKILTNMVMDVVKQNQELTSKIVDICKNTNSTNISNSSINSHNKTFNLNVFLNEQCKDAMNIMDFVDSLKLQLSDLECVGKLGYVEGISNIIVKNLKALDVHKRPVHCSDSKREVMYIKDEDKWEKENEEKNKLRKVIKKIANKNSRLLPQFKEKHPDCGKSESFFSDQYNKLIIEAMGGSGDNDLEKEDKIIRKIAKEVIIDKTIDNID